MAEFWEDEQLRASFVHGPARSSAMDREIRYIDWPEGLERTVRRDEDLDWSPPLRVIFAPLDLAGNAALPPLFDRYRIPAAFVSERLHSVTHGSGSHMRADGFYSSWFHYLCKSIDVEADPTQGPNSVQIVDPKRANARPLDKSNWTWLRGGFFLRWSPNTTKRNSSQQVPRAGSATLICFGGPHSLIERFRDLAGHPDWQKSIQDPYILYLIVFQEIFKEMDRQAWNLGNVFRDMENTVLEKAAEPGKDATTYDFVGLYNIAKHCTYLREGFNAVMESMADITAQHQRAQLAIDAGERDGIQSMLMHEKSLFKSTSLRVGSLDTRINSIISLSFNLVTQQESRMMFQDNQVMKAVALLTLFFLPMATVASIFGCQFFALDISESPPNFTVSPQIWIFLVTTIVITILMLPLWRMVQVGSGKRTSAPPNSSSASNVKWKPMASLSWMRRSTMKRDMPVELTSTT